MRRHLKVLGVLAILAVFMTGCFKIGGYKFSKMAVQNGEKTVLEVHLFPFSEEANRDYPFIVVVVPADDTDPEGGTSSTVTTQPKVLDVKGKFGGPYELVSDAALRAWILDGNGLGCDVEVGDGKIFVFRSSQRINDQARLMTKAVTRLGLKYTNSNDPFSGTLVNVRVLAGGWDDDVNDEANAGVPNGNEVACNSDFNTSYSVKSEPGAPTKTFRQRARQAARGR